MEHEAKLELRTMEVAEELAGGSSVEFLRCLRLKDQLFIDDHVHPLRAEKVSLVDDGNSNFARHAVSTELQLDLQRLHVEMFVVAVPEGVVHLVEGGDYGLAQRLFHQLCFCHGAV